MKRYRGLINRRLLFREKCQCSKNLLCFGCTVPRSLHRSIAQALGRSVDRSGRRSTRHSQTTQRTHGRTGRRESGRTDGRRSHWPENGVVLNITNVYRLLVCELLSVNLSLITNRYAIGYATVCNISLIT